MGASCRGILTSSLSGRRHQNRNGVKIMLGLAIVLTFLAGVVVGVLMTIAGALVLESMSEAHDDIVIP